MGIVVAWWLWLEIMGLAALPLAFRWFRWLPDRGYAFARPLGLLLTSYVLWMGGTFGLLRNSTGGALFSLALVAGVSAIVYRRGRREGEPGLIDWLRSHGRTVLAVELLFAGGLALWSLLRAFSPELTTSGGEKFMEIMYLNSIGRSDYFPPHDSWLSGYAISYYYFGYVMIATVTRLVGQAAHLTFNVGLASLFAMTCTGAFGLVYNLVALHERSARPGPRAGRRDRPVGYGFLGAVLVAVMGNLEGFLEVLYGARALPQAFWRWLDILEINEPYNLAAKASLIPTRAGWWWWRASRVINDLDPTGKSMGIQPIDEFPGFSFLLGDMHPHVLALPFVLLALAVALSVMLGPVYDRAARREETPGGWTAPLREISILVPLCLGALGFLNTWDLPIYLAMFAAAYAVGRWPRYGRFAWPFVRDVGLVAGAVSVLSFVLYLPFYLGFQSQAGLPLPALYVGTRFRQYFVMFGPFLVAVGGLLAALAARVQRAEPRGGLLPRWAGWTAALFLGPLALLFVTGLLMVLFRSDLIDSVRHIPEVQAVVGDAPPLAVLGRLMLVKLHTWVMPLVVAALAGMAITLVTVVGRRLPTDDRPQTTDDGSAALSSRSAVVRRRSSSSAALSFVLLCIAGGLLLTLSVEFLYLRDTFMVRMNTVFKFYFQAWVLLGIASAFAVYWLGRGREAAGEDEADAAPQGERPGRRATEPGRAPGGGLGRTACLVGFWLLFAMGMVYPVLGNISRAGNFDHAPTLDGSAYLAASEPDDYAAIEWLNKNVTGAPVILEKPGAGGDSYVYEGRVSALTGLPALLGWAGHEGQWRGNYDVQHAREPDIKTLYETPDVEQARALLDKYGITYVYVGPLEKSEYDPRGLEKFARFMEPVYQQGAVTIYKR